MTIFKVGLASTQAAKYAKSNVIIDKNIPQKAYQALNEAKAVIGNYAKSKKGRVLIDESVYHDSIDIRVGKTIEEIESANPERFVLDIYESNSEFLRRIYERLGLLFGDTHNYREHVMLTREKLANIGKISQDERHRMDWRDFNCYRQ